MRILHVTDVHCRLDNLEAILEAEQGYDIIAVTGDICCDSRLRRILGGRGARVYAVTGNMDDTHIARLLSDYGWLLDGRVAVHGDYVFAGIGGLQPLQNIEAVKRLLEQHGLVGGGRVLIVLAHHPVHGKLDTTFMGTHAGLYETRRLVEELHPRLYMHGHIHEARGVDRLGETILVNPGPAANGYYALIEVDRDDVRVELRRL